MGSASSSATTSGRRTDGQRAARFSGASALRGDGRTRRAAAPFERQRAIYPASERAPPASTHAPIVLRRPNLDVGFPLRMATWLGDLDIRGENDAPLLRRTRRFSQRPASSCWACMARGARVRRRVAVTTRVAAELGKPPREIAVRTSAPFRSNLVALERRTR